ncbi:hypothetical protein OKW31_002717 [Paraburkholderia atlantica]
MAFLLGIIGVVLVAWVVNALRNGNGRPNNSTASTRQQERRHSSTPSPRRPPDPPRQNPNTFRPSSVARKSSGIRFPDGGTAEPSRTSTAKSIDLGGLHDALTGAALEIARGLFQCTTCKVFYHEDSIELLRAENSGRCVACQATTLFAFARGQGPSAGKDFTPTVVTLANYHKHVGTVVTFEGFVPLVRESKRGSDFAVMFEKKSWKEGFKLVFFRGAVQGVGGKPYISSLEGKHVRVRGLLKKHPTFGYEIIVSEPGMILSVH